jgi:hypothetical protein
VGTARGLRKRRAGHARIARGPPSAGGSGRKSSITCSQRSANAPQKRWPVTSARHGATLGARRAWALRLAPAAQEESRLRTHRSLGRPGSLSGARPKSGCQSQRGAGRVRFGPSRRSVAEAHPTEHGASGRRPGTSLPGRRGVGSVRTPAFIRLHSLAGAPPRHLDFVGARSPELVTRRPVRRPPAAIRAARATVSTLAPLAGRFRRNVAAFRISAPTSARRSSIRTSISCSPCCDRS